MTFGPWPARGASSRVDAIRRSAMTIRLTVDGQPGAVGAAPEMPLLWALRDVLGITAVKYGCGMALCGACTVHVDGNPVRSCVLPVGRVTGAVTTLAGLSSPGHG